MIELIKILICISFLLYSCYSDFKTRRVADKTWVLMLCTTLPFILYEMITSGLPYIFRTVFSFTLVFTFVYILFMLNAFGGADAKVFIVLSVIIPTFPQVTQHNVPMLDIFALSTFANSVLMVAVVPLCLLVYNLATVPLKDLIKKPMLAITGYRTQADKMKEGHYKVLENSNDVVWVSPGIPFMIPITAGFLIAVLFGDLIYSII